VNNLELFQKEKKFLVCIDSDGCVMDSMNRKHEEFFAPALIEIWNLHEYASIVKQKWNRINLYSKTRGINRFLGLALILEELQNEQIPMQDYRVVEEWTSNAEVLSNEALMEYLESTSFDDEARERSLKRMLAWSRLVNERIQADPCMVRPFTEVKDTLKEIAAIADIAIVSSANKSALEEEWGLAGLKKYTGILCSQKEGSKTLCIGQLLNKGYIKSDSIMIGDALGDFMAAKKNSIGFYPIIAGDEELSWKNFRMKELSFFKKGEFQKERQKALLHKFYEGLL